MFRLQTDCFNYIKILLRMNSTHLYVCGTYAFSPTCAYIVSVYANQSHLLQWPAVCNLYMCWGSNKPPFVLFCRSFKKLPWCVPLYVVFVYYIREEELLVSSPCCFLPLSSLSSLAEAHSHLDTYYVHHFIISCVDGSKYFMHERILYNNILKPFNYLQTHRDDVCFNLTTFSLRDRRTLCYCSRF